MKDNYWDFGDFRITKRELLASITIVAIMFILGFVIAGKIDAWQIDKNVEYYKAARITDSEMFQYGMDTSIGNAFIYGDLEAVDAVTYPEIGGEYMYVEKVEEHYNMHTRTVTYTDSNGKTQTKTETYWSWDYAGSEEIHSQRIRFCGIEMDYSKIDIPADRYIDTIHKSGYVRFLYYGCQTKYTGTVYTNLQDGSMSDESLFYNGKEIDATVEGLTSCSGTVVFWIVWMVLTIGAVFGFCYFDNEWLEG